MFSKNKLPALAATLIVVLTCVLSTPSFAQCPVPGAPSVADITLSTTTAPNRIESAVRSLRTGGHIYNNEVTVIDGGTPYLQATNYKDLVKTVEPAVALAANTTFPDIRMNSDATALLVIWIDNTSNTSLKYQKYTVSSGTRIASSLVWGTSGGVGTIATGTLGHPITNISIDMDQTDHFVIQWTFSNNVWATTGTLIGTTLSALSTNTQITGVTGYTKPTVSTDDNYTGGDVSIYTPTGGTTTNCIVSFLFVDNDVTGSGTNYGVGLYQIDWKDLNLGTVTGGKSNAGTGSMLYNPTVTTTISNPRIDAPWASASFDKYDFCAVYQSQIGTNYYIYATTQYASIIHAGAQNYWVNYGGGPSPSREMYKHANTHPEVVYTGDVITIDWLFDDAITSCYTSNRYVAAYKLSWDGTSPAAMSSKDVLEINQSCTSNCDIPSISSPDIGTTDDSNNDFYNYWSGGCSNTFYTRARYYSDINKRDNENQQSVIAANLSGINLYPNPANTQLTIDPGYKPVNGSISVDITDMLGRSVKSVIINAKGINMVNTSDMPNGNYIVRVLINGDITTHKISILHN